MAFKHHIKVSADDIDQMGHVNNVVYVRYVQETAEAHWKSIAPKQLQKDVVWVVLRHEIDYKSPAFNGDILDAETWVESCEGAKMPRIVSIKNGEGKEVIRAKTIWCPLDGKTHRPKRISEELYSIFA